MRDPVNKGFRIFLYFSEPPANHMKYFDVDLAPQKKLLPGF